MLFEILVLIFVGYLLKRAFQDSLALDRFHVVLEVRNKFMEHVRILHQDPTIGKDVFIALLPAAMIIEEEFRKLQPSDYDCFEGPAEKIRRILRQEFDILTAA